MQPFPAGMAVEVLFFTNSGGRAAQATRFRPSLFSEVAFSTISKKLWVLADWTAVSNEKKPHLNPF